MRRIALMLATLSLAGCGYGASQTAHQAQISMIGMSEADLLACAGPPAKTTELNPAAFVDTYSYSPAAGNGFTLTLPFTLGGVALGGSGTGCRADIRLVDHRVAEVHYTGADDMTIGSDGVCAPIFRGCLRQPESTMRPVTGKNSHQASAFNPPPIPAQSSTAEEITTPVAGAPAAPKK